MTQGVFAGGSVIIIVLCTGALARAQDAPITEPGASTAQQPTDSSSNASPAEPASDQRALEAEFRAALASDTPPSTSSPPPTSPSGGAKLALLDLSFDLLGVGGSSSASESEIRALEAGGHDPHNRGFTLQNAELTFSGVVDPYLRGDANIVMQIDASGASTIELEEAYLTSLDLPWHLQLKAGQFFGAFGRLNPTHPHTWDFVDQPVINSRLLGGDGFRNPGAQVSWLAPLPFFLEILASAQNAQGETAVSFRGVPGDSIAGRTLIDRKVRDLGDLAYLLRVRTSFDVGDELTIVPGASGLFGPNATARDTRTEIYGLDLYVKWKPLANDQGWPFLGWQTEAMLRRYDAAAVITDATASAPRRTLNDWGFYSQVVWGFARPWTVAGRVDYARGQDEHWDASALSYETINDPTRDERERGSVAVSYYPSEFSKLRAQYNYDHSQFLKQGHAHSVYVQCEILFGAHGAHKF